jgi:hypothetical protein
MSIFSQIGFGNRKIENSTSPAAHNSTRIYVIADGTDGEKIGCDDNLIWYDVANNPPTNHTQQLKLAIQTLLTTEPQGERNMSNALLQSHLQVDDVVINPSGKATVKLSGPFTLGGVCDAPRVQNQLEKTALAVSGVTSVEFFINNKPLQEVLSGK